MDFLAYVINGLNLGSVYAIIALGYSMVYGIAKMLNFAHGDVIMIGGYMAFISIMSLNLPTWLALIIAMIVCTALGIIIEKLAYKPLRGVGSLAVLITAIGVSYFLQNAALIVWGSSAKIFPTILPNAEKISLFDDQVIITWEAIITIVTCVIIMILMTLLTEHTKVGKAMRAVSEDNGAAQLMGINVNKTISFTFAIGSCLAAVAGFLLLASYPMLMPTTGSMPGIKAFTAAVFGGIGSIPGAFIGGLLLGIIEILAKGYISTELSDAIVFGVLIVVLLVKPTGLLGKKISEKV